MAKGIYQLEHDIKASIALGLITGVRNFSSFGPNENLSNGFETDLARTPVNIIPFPLSAGELLEIVSDDPADNASVGITVLGPNGLFIPDTIILTLNGTTPVPIPGIISRINTGFVMPNSVSYDGALSIQQLGGGTVFATWAVDDQALNQGRFTTPANTTAYIGNLIGTMQKTGGSNAAIRVTIRTKSMLQTRFGLPFGFGLQRDGDTSIEFVNRHPQIFPGPMDIKMTSLAESAGVGAAGFFSGVVFDTSSPNS